MSVSGGISCQNCSNTISKGQRFCANCGHRVDYDTDKKKLCTGKTDGKPCYNLISPAIRFCSSCGTENETYISDETVTQTGECMTKIVRKDESHDDEYFSTEEDFADCAVRTKINKVTMNSSDNNRCNKCSNLVKTSHRFCKKCGNQIAQIKPKELTCLGITDDKQSANTITNDTRFGPNVSEENIISEDKCFNESSQEDVRETSLTIGASYGEKTTAVSIGSTFSEVCESSSDFDCSISSDSVVDTLDDDIIEELADQAKCASVEDEIIRQLKLGNAKSFAKTLAMQANLLEKVEVKVAVAGESGTGKSAFINAIRGVEPGDESFAEVGFGNTTMELNIYRHPKNEHILLYDLPGYNTTKVTLNWFLGKVTISEFDLFLIFIKAVPTTADKSFVAHLRREGVQFCFIRAKLDIDIDNALTKGQQQQEVLSEIKKKVNKSKDKFEDMKDSKIFYISSYEPSIGEMDDLVTFIEKEVAPAKFETVLFSIPALTKEVVNKKYKGLKRRVLFLSIRFAVFYPMVVSFDSHIKEEIEMSYRVFDLDKDLAKNVKNRKHPYSAEYIRKVMRDFSSRKGSDLASVNKRYRFCKNFLINLLKDLTEDAKAMYN